MKMNRNITVMLIVFTLAWSVNVRAQMGSMAMDSMHSRASSADDRRIAHDASSTEDSASASHKAKLVLAVRDGDSTWIVKAILTSVDSTGREAAVPKATLSFYVQRLFGLLPIGVDDNTAATDDSGIAELSFAKDLPGDAQGNVIIVARIEDNALTGPLVARDSGKWGIPLPIVADPFPRALWEPRAPFPLIITFCILLGGVWITYGFILTQLVNIKKGNKLNHDEA